MKLSTQPTIAVLFFLLLKPSTAQSDVYDVIVLGGELAGMTAAYKLTDFDVNIKLLVLEESDRVGGKGTPIVFSGNQIPVHVDNILTELGIGGMTVAVATILDRMVLSVPVHVNESVSNVVVTADSVFIVTTLGIQYISDYLIIALEQTQANAVNVQYPTNMVRTESNTRVFYGIVPDDTSSGIDYVSESILDGQSVAELVQMRRESTIPTAATTFAPILIERTNLNQSLEKLFINLINFLKVLLNSVQPR